MAARAVFLDRDGTLVHPRHYPTRPDELVLYDGIGPELRALQRAGFKLVVVTNQSGIAHGYLTEVHLLGLHAHLTSQLARLGVRLDAIYYCPHHPHAAIPALAVACDCRKPRPGMLLAAAANLNLDLAGSWLAGDILDDIEAGNRAGCRAVLVDLGTESAPTTRLRTPAYIACDTVHALRLIATLEGCATPGAPPDLCYRPAAWRRLFPRWPRLTPAHTTAHTPSTEETYAGAY
jgi:D-glycero-D-manno-heptose 1,7-bisphosphate phosphatase